MTIRNFSTRIVVSAALGIAALGAHVGVASAQAWPNKPIVWISPFAAGGGTDAFARPLAAQIDQQLGQRVLIENKAGAGGTIGASVAAKAAPDGYTFLIGAAHHSIAPHIYPKLDYDIEKDFVPVGLLAMPPQVIVVHPEKIKAKTLAELIAHAKANPDKLAYASAGAGTTHHLAGELFKIATQTKIQHVPYRGAGPAMQDLVAGHVDMMFDGLGTSANQIAAGRLRALAVAAPKRTPAFPDLPTSKEAGLAGYEVATWYAMFAPKGTPPDVIARMQKEMTTALNTPTIKEAWAKNGSEVTILMGNELGALVKSEVARWGKVVKEAGVKLDGN